jgi:hypothetical protein
MLDEGQPKIFGQDRVNYDERLFVTEGPFDSMFIKNGLAMAGSDVSLSQFSKDTVFVFDNEPRNREIVAKYEKIIKAGYSVVIYPNGVVEKDLNDMSLAGRDVQNIVECNIYSGLEATLKLNNWKKV